MSPPVLLLRDVHLGFGGTPLLEGAELSVTAGDRQCLVGRNGSGKSTLLKIAAGLIEPDGGERFLQPGTTIRYLPQEPELSGFASVLDYVAAGLAPGDDAHRARHLLERLGLGGGEAPGRLSGGEARRAALARALAPEPDILLLDEPTNHLDLPAIEWLERELGGLRSAIVLISHDRRFLERLSRATVWLDRGRTRRLEQGFGAFEGWRDELLALEAAERHKLGRRIAQEEDWVRYGVTARRKRNQGRLARLGELRQQHREARGPTGKVRMAASEAALSGRLVLEAEGVAKSFGGPPIVRGLDLRILRGDRLGIVGPNGAGKSTILALLTGGLAPDGGRVRLGANLEMATLDQQRRSLDPARTLAETLTGGRGDTVEVAGRTKHVIGYMQDFLFRPEQAQTPVGALSGGERGRLALAAVLTRPSNLLVLDEPTNDLDLETLDLLQELLADYPGTVLLVSHDRDFLDRTVSSTLAFEGEGRWQEYAGGYSDMVAQRGHGVAAAGEAAATRRPGREARPAEPPQRAQPQRRLGFREKHALATLPARMEALQAELRRLEAKLARPDLYARDPAGFARTTAEHAARSADLAAAEEEWLALELLREELEGSG